VPLNRFLTASLVIYALYLPLDAVPGGDVAMRSTTTRAGGLALPWLAVVAVIGFVRNRILRAAGDAAAAAAGRAVSSRERIAGFRAYSARAHTLLPLSRLHRASSGSAPRAPRAFKSR